MKLLGVNNETAFEMKIIYYCLSTILKENCLIFIQMQFSIGETLLPCKMLILLTFDVDIFFGRKNPTKMLLMI